MTDAGWTAGPTEAGYYWFRDHAGRTYMYPVFKNDKGECCVMLASAPDPLAQTVCITHIPFGLGFIGSWLGPLSPTDRQQGYKAAVEKLRQHAMTYDDEANEILDSGDLSGPSGEFQYVAKTLRQIAREIEQAAQDEKPTKEDL